MSSYWTASGERPFFADDVMVVFTIILTIRRFIFCSDNTLFTALSRPPHRILLFTPPLTPNLNHPDLPYVLNITYQGTLTVMTRAISTKVVEVVVGVKTGFISGFVAKFQCPH